MHETRLESLNLSVEQAEGARVGDLKAGQRVRRQLLIRLSQFRVSMGIGAVFAKVALLGLLKVLTYLGLVVIVRNVEHFVLHF